MKRNVVIIGASDYCKYTIDIIEQENKFHVLGIFDKSLKNDKSFYGYKIMGYLKELKELSNRDPDIYGIVAIGDNFT
ncbi:transferase, partial [Gramella sp. KN1008]